jgi:uncharacterized protein with HEPN domain
VPRTVLLRLTDIHDTIVGIQALVGVATIDDFANSWSMQRAVERGIEIISEASRHIPNDLKGLAPEMPWHQIAAIGNLLRHEYQRVDVTATWNIVEVYLPTLATAIERLMMEAEQREKE